MREKPVRPDHAVRAIQEGSMKIRANTMKKLTALILAAVLIFSAAAAETMWVFCNGYVNVRQSPSKNSTIVGRLDSGEEFETDGTVRNGFIQALGIGENGDAWIFAGFTSDEQPEKTDKQYVCVAKKRVACRRWIKGPRIKGKTGWLYNGSNVKVYWRTSEWAVTSRGYIMTEWLEVDPE